MKRGFQMILSLRLPQKNSWLFQARQRTNEPDTAISLTLNSSCILTNYFQSYRLRLRRHPVEPEPLPQISPSSIYNIKTCYKLISQIFKYSYIRCTLTNKFQLYMFHPIKLLCVDLFVRTYRHSNANRLLMDNCTIDCIQIVGNFTVTQACQFTQNYCNQDTIQIIQGYYCLIHESFILLLIIAALFLTLIYYAINIVIEDYMAPCLEQFIVKFNISEALAGITFLALANGAPDIITAIVAGTSSSDSTSLLPFGSLFGASLFSMAIILSKVIDLSPEEKVQLNMKEVLVPLGFYIAGTTYLVLVSIISGKMNLILAFIFLGLYPLYIIFVIYSQKKKASRKRKQQLSILTQDKIEQKSSQQKIQQVIDDIHKEQDIEDKEDQEKPNRMFFHQVRIMWKFVFTYTLPLVLKDKWVPTLIYPALIASPFVLCLAKGIPQAFSSGPASIPYAVWYSFPSIALLIYSIFSNLRGRRPSLGILFNIYSFVVSISWIALVAGVLINVMQLLQLLTNINSVFLGLTVFAWANCMADYLSITAFVKRGYKFTAISGIFSAQLFNYLIGFGISCIINSIDGEYNFKIFSLGDSTFDELSQLIVMFVICLSLGYMITLFVIVVRNKGIISSKTKYFSRAYYITFVGIALVMSVSSDFFRQYSCDMIL